MSRARAAGERGQASPEWIGLVFLLVTLLSAALALLGPLPLALSIARGVGAKIVCAVRLGNCGSESELETAYGSQLAREVRSHAPSLIYEHGMRALPVDYRSCRAAGCAGSNRSGVVARSAAGERATAFVHVVDCRGSAGFVAASTQDCSGERAGNLYLQYWL